MADFSSLGNLPPELRNALNTETSGEVERGSDIHSDTPGELEAITEKGTPVADDIILIEDSADDDSKKKILIGSLPASAGSDSSAIHDNVSAEIDAITEKVTPVNADLIVIEDSAAANVKKKAQIGNIPGISNAIHDNVAAEIDSIAEKGTPVSGDLIIIEDSAAANVKKKVQIGNLPTTDATAIHDNIAAEINAIAEKATPVNADLIIIEDSADTNNKKKVQVGNLPAIAVTADNIPTLQWSSVSVVNVISAPGKSNSLVATLSDGNQYTATAPLTMNMATSGLGGIEASDSEAGDTWFYLYLVPSGGDFDVISSSNDPETGPADYAGAWLYIGAVRNDSGSDILPFNQTHRRFQYELKVSPGALTADGSWNNLNIDGEVPKTAGEVQLFSHLGLGAFNLSYRPVGVSTLSLFFQEDEQGFEVSMILPSSTKAIEYTVTAGGTATIYVVGWNDEYIYHF